MALFISSGSKVRRQKNQQKLLLGFAGIVIQKQHKVSQEKNQ
jgi:hypothetical protein